MKKQISFPIAVHDLGNIIRLDVSDLVLFIYFENLSRKNNISGVKTIHIDIDQLFTNGIKIIKRIRGILGLGERVFARKTVVARIDKKMAIAFQMDHHMQSALPGKYRYGLFYKGDLVSIALFSGGRHMREEEANYRSFELLRFCHKGELIVIGGISKLIQRFVNDFNPSDIMTYADLDWCQQSSLEQIGFIEVSVKEPQTFLIQNGIRQYRFEEKDDGYFVQNSGSLKLKRIL